MNRFQKGLVVFGALSLAACLKLGGDFAFGYSLKPLDWSPDGKWIVAELAYGGFRDGYALALVSAKTGRVERTLFNNVNETEGCHWATFSPDSRYITYHRVCMGDYVVDLQATHTATIGTGSKATWSPDGKWLALCDQSNGVYRIHPDGSGRQSLGKKGEPYWRQDGTLEVLEQARPCMSPNGHWCAYEKPNTEVDGGLVVVGSCLWVRDRAGRERKISKQASGFEWRPNGELVYTEKRDAGWSVVAYNPQTQQHRVLTDGSSWILSRDGSQLALFGENQVRTVHL